MNGTTFPDGRRIYTFGSKNKKKAVFDHPRSEDIYKYNRKLREERRLAYVALTRGEESVLALWSNKDHKNKNSGPSIFISESCILDMDDTNQSTDLEDTVPIENPTKEKLEE
jgi:ATP-dependent exoDNAse (exonuclease V) beta subunit